MLKEGGLLILTIIFTSHITHASPSSDWDWATPTQSEEGIHEPCTLEAEATGVSMATAVSTASDRTTRTRSNIHDGILSARQYSIMVQVTSRCLIPLVCAVGITANILSICIFFHPAIKMPSSTKMYMKALSICDTVYLTLALWSEVVEFFLPLNPTLVSKISAYGVPYYKRTLMGGAVGMSIFLVVIISIERCFAVCFPLKASNFVLHTHPKLPILISFLAQVVLAILLFLCYDVQSYADPLQKTTMWRVGYTEFATRGDFLKGYAVCMEILYRGLSVGIIVLCTAAIIVSLRLASRRRQTLTNTSMSPTDARVTRMLLGVALLFLVCMLPSLFLTVVSKLSSEWHVRGRQHYMYLCMVKLGQLTSRLNSAANFFVYVMTSPNFRAVLKMVVCGRRRGGNETSSLSCSSTALGETTLSKTSGLTTQASSEGTTTL